jgi:hypothetical protein
MLPSYRTLLACSAIWVCSAPVLWSQVAIEPRPKPAVRAEAVPKSNLRVDSTLVLIPVTVTDPMNRFVTGLEKENFKIFEDRKEQDLSQFSSEDAPLSVGVVFDCSGSMGKKLDQSRQAVAQFFKTANPEDEFFLVQFHDAAELVQPFTTSLEEIQNRLTFTQSKGRTALLDAIYLALHEMKKALAGPGLLTDIAEQTGGRQYAVENLNELPDIASKIGVELRNQYILGYSPQNREHDGKYRRVQVKLVQPRGLPPLRAFWRLGYYAPSQ